MHVLILPSWYFPADTQEIGGRMFHQLAFDLRQQGFDARILFAELNLSSPLRQESHFGIEEGVPTYRLRQWFPPKFHSLTINLWVRKYIRILRDYMDKEGKPDLIHAQSYLAGFIAAALNVKTGIPFIVTERLSLFITGEVPARYQRLIKETFKSASLITCVSPGLKKYLLPYTTLPVEVIPNYYNPDIFYPQSTVEKNKIFTWVTVGEPSYIKGLDILLHAYGAVRQQFPLAKMQLILIDRIKEKEELMKIADPYKISDEIIWDGLISQNKMADILRSSHVFVSASRVETFGKAILEAQACGLPVIATHTDGANYIITSPEQGRLVDANNVQHLVVAMIEMFNQYNNFSSEKISTSVGAQFKKEVVINQWKEIYNSLSA